MNSRTWVQHGHIEGPFQRRVFPSYHSLEFTPLHALDDDAEVMTICFNAIMTETAGNNILDKHSKKTQTVKCDTRGDLNKVKNTTEMEKYKEINKEIIRKPKKNGTAHGNWGDPCKNNNRME